MKNVFNRMFIIYGVIFAIGYSIFNVKQYHLQFVDAYRYSADRLIDCTAKRCSGQDLRDGAIYYEHILAIFNSPNAWNALGYCYYYLGFYELSKKCFQKAIHIEPGRFGFHSNLAASYIKLKQYAKAKHELEFVVKKLENVTDFFHHDMVLPSLPESAQEAGVGDNVKLKAGYAWYLAKQQADRLTQYLQGKHQEKMDEIDLYYYVPTFTIQYQGQAHKVL